MNARTLGTKPLAVTGSVLLVLALTAGAGALGSDHVAPDRAAAQAPRPLVPQGDSLDPVLTRVTGVPTYIPNTTTVVDGRPNLHEGVLRTTPLLDTRSLTGHPIGSLHDPVQDLELALGRLVQSGTQAGVEPMADVGPANEVLAILLGETEGRVYDGFPMLNLNRGAVTADHVPEAYKMKRLSDTGTTIVSQIDGLEHRVWEVTINMLWYGQNFDSDTFLIRIPYEAHALDELQINWRVYSLIQEDLAPTTILNDGFGRIFHGLDSTFQTLPAGHLNELTVRYPSLQHFRGLYVWGWGSHPPRVQFLQPVFETSADGALNWAGQSFTTRTAALSIDGIGDAAPEKKAYQVAQAAVAGASGDAIVAMVTDPATLPLGTYREWLRLADDLRQLPPEAWNVLAAQDGLARGEFGPYDIVLAYVNNEIYGETPYAQPGAEGKGGVLRDWGQGGQVHVKIINLDNITHYYRNVDFGSALSRKNADAFGNGRFSFDKFNPKPSYGAPKVAEMQWRTGWGFVPHLGIAAQDGLFPRAMDREELVPFTNQLGEKHLGYVFQNVSGYWRFNPPEAIRAGDRIPAGQPLRDVDGVDGVRIGLDTEAFGVANMPEGPITTHPDQERFPEVSFPGFLRNPGGGDIIPPTPVWAPFLTLNPETGTLFDPEGRYWVDATYFHGRPVDAGASILANVEAPRAAGQLFYQFDPLFHDNMIFSYHPRSDIVR